MSSAKQITRKAKSNLAFTLACLPRQRKRDMTTFYAFCRVIDDLADDTEIPLENRKSELAAWYHGIKSGFEQPDELQAEITALIARYAISKEPFLNLIDGCTSDLQPQRFNTWEDLKDYTYRVASCVGMISTCIFGCRHPDSEKYAIALGHALQLTNILRDVDEDLSNGGRIYLPLDELTQFDYSEQDLLERTYDDRFIAMMMRQAKRADELYLQALSYLQPEDSKALQAAEAMRKIYSSLLEKMRADRFQVFNQRYTISKVHKAGILISTLLVR